jgi:hypothetical protein
MLPFFGVCRPEQAGPASRLTNLKKKIKALLAMNCFVVENSKELQCPASSGSVDDRARWSSC